MKSISKKSGFTLIELSIVLVIIGLIIGGVLAGQDLIKGAELRAAAGQIEKIDTVVNAFRNKYNGLPGDIASPANFGFDPGSAGAAGLLGNGVLDPQGAALLEEPALFFDHLASAGLITETLAATTANVTSGGVAATMSTYAPISKLGKGISVRAQSFGGTNYYMMDASTAISNVGVITPVYGMPPITAFGLDTKLDDGLPITGKVVAVDTVAAAASGGRVNAGALAGACVNTTPNPNIYQTSTQAIADTNACAIRIKASF
jgi:prepilin-type N-terminal cleavage/methylation domain-containing protein